MCACVALQERLNDEVTGLKQKLRSKEQELSSTDMHADRCTHVGGGGGRGRVLKRRGWRRGRAGAPSRACVYSYSVRPRVCVCLRAHPAPACARVCLPACSLRVSRGKDAELVAVRAELAQRDSMIASLRGQLKGER